MIPTSATEASALFDPTTGVFAGKVSDQSHHPIVTGGLWALAFRAPGSGFDPHTLFLTAGINGKLTAFSHRLRRYRSRFALGLGAIAFLRRKARG